MSFPALPAGFPRDPFEADIIARLRVRPMTGVTGPDRRLAAEALAARGVVVVREGAGRETGVLLVCRPPLDPRRLSPDPFAGLRPTAASNPERRDG